ncbi:MAG: phosphoribosylglycinamide formyltransferase [Candidatus Hodarchaeota archaeon]
MSQRIVILGSEERQIFLCLVGYLRKHQSAEIVLVIFDRPSPSLAQTLHRMGCEFQVIRHHKISSRKREDYEQELLEVVNKARPDWIILCGYSWILSPVFVRRFQWRILNIHPSLLPAFPGADAIEDAWWWGVKITGVTIHFVDEKVDNGPIILQEAYHIKNNDTQETIYDALVEIGKELFKKAINLVLTKKVCIEGRRVKVEESKW